MVLNGNALVIIGIKLPINSLLSITDSPNSPKLCKRCLSKYSNMDNGFHSEVTLNLARALATDGHNHYTECIVHDEIFAERWGPASKALSRGKS